MARFVVLTGLSGAGKTTALQALEDMGFYTVDNLPPVLWQELYVQATASGYSKIAVGIDVRTRAFLPTIDVSLHDLRQQGVTADIVFLDAANEVLIKRYNLTRRTHPLGQAPLLADIATERDALGYLRAHADVVLDTSRYSPRELAENLQQVFQEGQLFRLRIVSFGFKRGVPIDADNIFDLRALPNPYYEAALRAIDGRDPRVQAYVFQAATLEFYSDLREMIRKLSSMAQTSGRSSYTIAVGCTGGQHRSVAVAERLGLDLRDSFNTHIEHRDVEAALLEHQNGSHG